MLEVCIKVTLSLHCCLSYQWIIYKKILDIATQQGYLTPIGADPIKMRTSLYADDAMVSIKPIISDVEHLKFLLAQFGMATGLATNMEKS
jgi:hypothetical protein